MEHRIYTWEVPGDPERSAWECSCGRGGTTDSDRVDLASDKHIPAGDTRVDTNQPL